ncbi:MAG TPA: hypothetical protein V6C65_19770 [Allocoleopsis sp.]
MYPTNQHDDSVSSSFSYPMPNLNLLPDSLSSIPPTPQDPCKCHQPIGPATQREILRQAQWSFNLYFVTIAASTVIGAIGGGLLLGGHTTEGALTAAAGFGSSACCVQMGKDSQEKLELLLERLENLSNPG